MNAWPAVFRLSPVAGPDADRIQAAAGYGKVDLTFFYFEKEGLS
jgi:hypothetical protein